MENYSHVTQNHMTDAREGETKPFDCLEAIDWGLKLAIFTSIFYFHRVGSVYISIIVYYVSINVSTYLPVCQRILSLSAEVGQCRHIFRLDTRDKHRYSSLSFFYSHPHYFTL